MKHLKTPKEAFENKANRLAVMLEKQAQINSMFIPSKIDLDAKKFWTMRMKMAMDVEISEMLEQMRFKWWKKNQQEIDEKELKYELIDALHFLLSMMIIWGMDSNEIYEMYLTKAQENIDRQQRGY